METSEIDRELEKDDNGDGETHVKTKKSKARLMSDDSDSSNGQEDIVDKCENGVTDMNDCDKVVNSVKCISSNSDVKENGISSEALEAVDCEENIKISAPEEEEIEAKFSSEED